MATPNLEIHINGDHFQADGTTTLSAQVGLATRTVVVTKHNHGDAALIVTSATIENESNVTVEGTPSDGPILAGSTQQFSLMVTPSGYGAFSFDIVTVSNDPDAPVLTVTVEGVALAPPEDDEVWRAQRRRRDWIAARRKRHWTFSR